MASAKELRKQIGSIKNTQKITSAMEMVAASKMRKALWIILGVLILDQALKIWVKTSFTLGEDLVITDWFILHFTENPGMAFGVATSLQKVTRACAARNPSRNTPQTLRRRRAGSQRGSKRARAA